MATENRQVRLRAHPRMCTHMCCARVVVLHVQAGLHAFHNKAYAMTCVHAWE